MSCRVDPRLKISDVTDAGNFVRLIELFPPTLPAPHLLRDNQNIDLSSRFERLLQSITTLETLADGFCLPELKDADRIHLNSVGLASELRRRTGSAIVPTITLRDSNRQQILGTVAYAIFAGIENILLVRGDPYSAKEERVPMNVYDFKTISSIVSLFRRMESHLTGGKKAITILCPINLAKSNDSKYVDTIRERESAGVDLLIAESLFEDVQNHLERVRVIRKAGIRLPIIHTIFPLKNVEDATNLVRKFGWRISEDELDGLKRSGSEFGVAKARERYRELLNHRDQAEGASISTRGDPEIARLITT